MVGVCSKCGKKLSMYNPGKLCFACQKKKLEQEKTSGNDLIDAQGLADIIGLSDAESVKRLGRKGKLPPRIPAIRRWLWHKDIVEAWIKSGGQMANLKDEVDTNMLALRHELGLPQKHYTRSGLEF